MTRNNSQTSEREHHIIFVDIVKYSKRDSRVQKGIVEILNSIIKNLIKDINAYKEDTKKIDPSYIPIGDGAAICIPVENFKQLDALNLGIRIISEVHNSNKKQFKTLDNHSTKEKYDAELWSNDINAFAVRVVVGRGNLYPYCDLNNNRNWAGKHLNTAARLLTFPDAHQLVLSKTAKRALPGFPIVDCNLNEKNFLETGEVVIKEQPYGGWQLVDLEGIDSTPILEKDWKIAEIADGYDELPHVWIRTNHSIHNVNWVKVDSETRFVISKFVYDNYCPRHIKDVFEVQGLQHNPNVFRVAGRHIEQNGPIFLKKCKAHMSDRTLGRIIGVQNAIADATYDDGSETPKPIFPYGHYLRALETREGNYFGRASFKNEGDRLVTALPFLEEAKTGKVMHFSRKANNNEIRSVGEKLGRVNDVLSRADLPVFLTDMFEWKEKELSSVIRFVKDCDRNVLDRRSYLVHAELELIIWVWEKVESELKPDIERLSGSSAAPIVLHDLHPHNVFMENSECVLIIDFEQARKDWPEEASFMFSLHRFCRDPIRERYRLKQIDGTSKEEFVDIAVTPVEQFIEGYKCARPQAIAYGEMQKYLTWAMAINLAKLLGCVAYGHGKNDPLGRKESVWYSEVVKFISYLKELKLLIPVLNEIENGKR